VCSSDLQGGRNVARANPNETDKGDK